LEVSFHASSNQFPDRGRAVLPVLMSKAQAQVAASDIHTMALSASTFSLTSSRMAAQKASNPMVRQFAMLEATEQEAVMEAMRMAGVTIPAQVPVPQAKLQMAQALEAASGQAFDREYLRGQKMGHEELLAIHQRIAQGGSSPAERIIGTLSVPAIRTHLAMIEMMIGQG
jgi:putative membrane protein